MSKELSDILATIPQGDTLEHYGVLGMKWGVRKDRGTGKRVGKPVAGTDAAKRGAPSVSPKPSTNVTRAKKPSTNVVRTKKPTVPEPKVEKRDKPKKFKLNTKKLDSMSLQELKETAERLRIQNEILNNSTLTSKEMVKKRAIERIKIEQEYRRLTAGPPTMKQKAVGALKDILFDVGKQQAKRLLNNAARQQLDAFFPPSNEGKKTVDAEKEKKKK